MHANHHLLNAVVFICGAVVMIFELAGSRVLGPYVGTSIFVWTNLIGIILASLSFGYYLGGKLADKKPHQSVLSLIIFLSALGIALSFLAKDPLLGYLLTAIDDIKLSSALASILLFAVPSVLLGMVSPYAAKLRLHALETSGSTVGNLYAISTAGSIAGTFLAGFYLIPHFGTNKVLLLIVLTLLITSLAVQAPQLWRTKLLVVVLCLTTWSFLNEFNRFGEENGFIDVDTAYNRVWIYDGKHVDSGKPIRSLAINNEHSSAMYLDSDDLVYEYTKFYHLARHFKPNFSKTLMLGGAAYSFPKDFLRTYAEATMDVVEIDPKVTELARTYFRLQSDPRLTIYHEDGRVYLNQNTESYDVIFGDAFSSQYSLPYQMTTAEAVQKTYDSLTDDGVVLLNIISAIEGDKGKFLRAEYATYASIFPHVYLFPVRVPQRGDEIQNIMLVAVKGAAEPILSSDDPVLNGYLQHRWMPQVSNDLPVLTDDLAPVERYVSDMLFS